MSIYRRGDIWWITFTTPNGQRIRRSAGTAVKTKAQEYHDRERARCWDEQRLGVKPDRSWQEAAVQWLKEAGHKRSHADDVAKLRYLDQFLGNLTLGQIKREVVERIGERKASESTPANANRYLALIRSILRKARDDWEWIDHIPKVRLYRESKRRIRFLTKEEATQLLNELPPHLRDMTEFSLCTGLRQSNVSYLRWDQVDMQRSVAWVHADEAKAGRPIGVPLNQDAMGVLRRNLERHPEYVFTYQGKPVDRTSTKAWYAALGRARIEDFRWHDLRHTWASWHVQSGTSLNELMELGGWSTVEMVRRYAHLAPDHLRTAAGRIDGTFSSQSPKVVPIRVANG